MKIKRLVLLIVVIFMSIFISGCKGNNENNENNESYLSGTELAKKMLSNERLDASGLNDGNNIFVSGAKDFRELSRKALDNIRGEYLDISEKTEVTKTGNKITWKNIGESTNAISYFNNLTGNISHYAMSIANTIDITKTNVRIVDKWVKTGNTKLLLKVDENSETIYEITEDQTNVCTRSKNNYGQNVYDVYLENTSSRTTTRMKYIPNSRYERYEENAYGDNLLFIADKSKGYWETVVIAEFSTHYNFQVIVMKNDITYTYNYDVDNNTLGTLTIINGNRTADIISFDNHMASLYVGVLGGVKSIEIEADVILKPDSNLRGDVYDLGNGDYVTTGYKSATINLNNGKKISGDDVYVDGKLKVIRTLVTYNSDNYVAELQLSFAQKEVIKEEELVEDPNNPGNFIPTRPIIEYQQYSFDEKMAIIQQFISEVGFINSYNFNYIISSIKYASTEMNSFINYYRIHGYKVNSRAELSKAFNVERDNLRDLHSELNKYLSYEVIDMNDQEKMKDNMLFPSVTNIDANNVTNNNTKIKINGLSLTIDDTMLMVIDNEKYTIGIGVVDVTTDVINYYPVYLGAEEFVYSGTSTFTATTTGEFNINIDGDGNYSLVAYIATKEGIRVSKPVYVPFNTVNEFTYSKGILECSYTKDSNNYLLVKQSYLENVNISSTISDVNTYEQLETLLVETSNEYGIVEKYDVYTLQDNEWVKVDKESFVITTGYYKLDFLMFNDNIDDYLSSSVILNLE